MPLLHPLYLTTDLSDLSAKDVARVKSSLAHRKYGDSDRVRALKSVSQRKVTLRTKFGISLDDYDAILQEQGGKCAICAAQPSGNDTYRLAKSLAVDHDHATNKIRGLLCDLCNRAIGQLHDDPFLLRKAIEYLENPVLDKMEKNGFEIGKTITIRKGRAKVWNERTDVSTDDLANLYFSNDPSMSLHKLAEMFGMSSGAIHHRLHKAGFILRNKKQARQLRELRKLVV